MKTPFLTSIVEAAQLRQAQNKAAAREILMPIWEGLDATARPDLACVVAHYLADAMEQLSDELVWDTRALKAANDARALGIITLDGVGSIDAFYPSLYLNLADAHLRHGDLDGCQEHLKSARHAISVSPNNSPYAQYIRKGVEALALRLEARRQEERP